MKWFKHYSNASLSNALTELMAEHGLKGYGRYWLLIEKMCEKFDGEQDTKFVFDTVGLRGLLGFHRNQDLIKFLSSLNQVGIMSHTSRNQVIEINTDILLRLQGRDFKRANKKRGENAPKNKIKNKIKNKNIEKNVSASADALSYENITTLYNKYAPQGRGYDMMYLSPSAMQNFLKAQGFPPFHTVEGWEELFKTVFKSKWVLSKPFINLIWLLDIDNATKALNWAKSENNNSGEMSPTEQARKIEEELKAKGEW